MKEINLRTCGIIKRDLTFVFLEYWNEKRKSVGLKNIQGDMAKHFINLVKETYRSKKLNKQTKKDNFK